MFLIDNVILLPIAFLLVKIALIAAIIWGTAMFYKRSFAITASETNIDYAANIGVTIVALVLVVAVGFADRDMFYKTQPAVTETAPVYNLQPQTFIPMPVAPMEDRANEAVRQNREENQETKDRFLNLAK